MSDLKLHVFGFSGREGVVEEAWIQELQIESLSDLRKEIVMMSKIKENDKKNRKNSIKKHNSEMMNYREIDRKQIAQNAHVTGR